MDTKDIIKNLYKVDKPIIKYEILETDIDLILKQVETTRDIAKEKLTKFNGDIVRAIIDIFDTL